MVQFINNEIPNNLKQPAKQKIYKRCKIIKFTYKDNFEWGKGLVTDFEGNFNLMCANKRALRLLAKVLDNKMVKE